MPKKKKLKQDPAALIQSFSKNLLGLKFMQRAKKVAEKESSDYSDDDDDEEDNNNGNNSVKLDTSKIQKLKTKPKCIMNPSYQSCERLRFGRLSFKGMNLDIETMMYNNSALDKSHDSSFDSAKAGGGGGGGGGGGATKRPAGVDWDDEEDDEYDD